MAVTVASAALLGVRARTVEVEVDLLRRLPAVCIVGLPASAVRESAERVRSAIEASGHDFPRKRVVINLAPADLRKEGTLLDLPVAIGILEASGAILPGKTDAMLFAGELALDGRLRPVRGAISLARHASENGFTLVVPAANATQAALVPEVEIWAPETLRDVVAWLNGQEVPRLSSAPPREPPVHTVDLSEVRGQLIARRALEISAAGGHHLLMIGPPGCGKSMLAQRLPTILPPLELSEALEATEIHSAGGLLADGMLDAPPFRAPHHTVTMAGLVGNRRLRPGEIALAHRGVLFLDEAPEFRRSALEVLRQPLEDGEIQLTRAEGTVTWPAAVRLVLACNPCPCGHHGSVKPCHCSESAVRAYRRKLSGPILDRIDLHVELEPVDPCALFERAPTETSMSVRERVIAARDRQRSRQGRTDNARLDPRQLQDLAAFDAASQSLLRSASRRFGFSARSTARIQRVARTIADLAASADVREDHVAEAISFRPLEGLH